jgi:serine/threonine protein kinase
MDTGLEYLQKSCQPPLIHRDVKTKIIMLSADLDANISDFGLMKVFANEFMTHITTQPAGTLGYLDPEYYNTARLSEKSDVYSFGVVLLELITGQPPAISTSDTESIHIAQWCAMGAPEALGIMVQPIQPICHLSFVLYLGASSEKKRTGYSPSLCLSSHGLSSDWVGHGAAGVTGCR